MAKRTYILRKTNQVESTTKKNEEISESKIDSQKENNENFQNDRKYGISKRITHEEYSTYHYYHTVYPGLSDQEEYAKSQEDGWFYVD